MQTYKDQFKPWYDGCHILPSGTPIPYYLAITCGQAATSKTANDAIFKMINQEELK